MGIQQTFIGPLASTSGTLSASAGPSQDTFGTGTPYTSGAITAVATGGTGSYTYLWTRLSGDAYTINSPTSASTTVTISLLVTDIKSAVFRCAVNDGTATVNTNTVTITRERT